jgi:hypothetical protein
MKQYMTQEEWNRLDEWVRIERVRLRNRGITFGLLLLTFLAIVAA